MVTLFFRHILGEEYIALITLHSTLYSLPVLEFWASFRIANWHWVLSEDVLKSSGAKPVLCTQTGPSVVRNRPRSPVFSESVSISGNHLANYPKKASATALVNPSPLVVADPANASSLAGNLNLYSVAAQGFLDVQKEKAIIR